MSSAVVDRQGDYRRRLLRPVKRTRRGRWRALPIWRAAPLDDRHLARSFRATISTGCRHHAHMEHRERIFYLRKVVKKGRPRIRPPGALSFALAPTRRLQKCRQRSKSPLLVATVADLCEAYTETANFRHQTTCERRTGAAACRHNHDPFAGMRSARDAQPMNRPPAVAI